MTKTTTRLEALSDGVFAIVIALLAGEISIRTYAGATNLSLVSLGQKIVANWPQYFAGFTSFTAMLLVWLGHHRVIGQLGRANQRLILLNGLGLFLVVLFPYPSRMVGQFIGTGAQETAIAFYAAYSGLLTLSMAGLTAYLIRHPRLLVSASTSVPWLKKLLRQQVAGFLLYELVAVLAFYYPISALVLLFLLAALWIVVTNDGKEEDL